MQLPHLNAFFIHSTRVVRGLYALHHGVSNSRNLGGETGTLDGPFAAKYLLQAPTLEIICMIVSLNPYLLGSLALRCR
jgi:hypothetical protein